MRPRRSALAAWIPSLRWCSITSVSVRPSAAARRLSSPYRAGSSRRVVLFICKSISCLRPSCHVPFRDLSPERRTGRMERLIRARFAKQRPLKGLRIAACLHVTTETANLARTLQAGGAEVFLCGSNPLSTQDDVAAALVSEYGIATFAIKGEDQRTYYSHIVSCIEARPHITMDDGCDLVTVLHTKMKGHLAG